MKLAVWTTESMMSCKRLVLAGILCLFSAQLFAESCRTLAQLFITNNIQHRMSCRN